MSCNQKNCHQSNDALILSIIFYNNLPQNSIEEESARTTTTTTKKIYSFERISMMMNCDKNAENLRIFEWMWTQFFFFILILPQQKRKSSTIFIYIHSTFRTFIHSFIRQVFVIHFQWCLISTKKKRKKNHPRHYRISNWKVNVHVYNNVNIYSGNNNFVCLFATQFLAVSLSFFFFFCCYKNITFTCPYTVNQWLLWNGSNRMNRDPFLLLLSPPPATTTTTIINKILQS